MNRDTEKDIHNARVYAKSMREFAAGRDFVEAIVIRHVADLLDKMANKIENLEGANNGKTDHM